MTLKRLAVRDAWGLIEVVEQDGEITLQFGNQTAQSGWFPARPYQLAFGYYRALLTSLVFHPQPERLNLYGLGGGALARFVLEYTKLHLTTHDLRPVLQDIAREYFDLNTDDPRLTLRFGDIADHDWLKGTPPADLIWLDVFDERGMVPIPPRSMAVLADQLDDQGVLCANIWRNALNDVTKLNTALAPHFAPTPLILRVPERYNTVVCYRKTPWTAEDIQKARVRLTQWSPVVHETIREALQWLHPVPGTTGTKKNW